MIWIPLRAEARQRAVIRHSLAIRPSLAIAACLILSCLFAPGRARAQTDLDSDSTTQPWFEGITREQAQKARQIFLEGNELAKFPDYVAAVEKYQAAIELWDHPAFHYNLANVQYALVRLVEAYRSLHQALRHGQGPLSDAKYRSGIELRKRLERQLGHIEIVCEQPAVKVTLDGEHVFVGERRYQEVVLPGPHQLTGKAGHESSIHDVVLKPGEKVTIHVRLRKQGRLEYRRRWSRWIPYAVLGAGTLFVASAGYFDRTSTDRFDQFDARYAASCPGGCRGAIAQELKDLRASAEQRQRIAIAIYAAGGVVLATGVVLAYMNRKLAFEVRGDRDDMELTVVPSVLPEGAFVNARWRF
ncbi:MAG: tetratricopeptide repeat protein [Proteobacteria bacterium]|nr:tetratricopeptide repeat protein [Pseudomonadota bacterium]